MIKQIVFTVVISALCIFGSTTIYAAEEAATTQNAPKESQSSGIKAIGIILINAEDTSKVILLTKVQDPQNPQGKMMGVPLLLNDMGKKLVEEYGIMGLKADEENGMERIQQETETKVLYVGGNIVKDGGMDVLDVAEYTPAAEYMKQMEQNQKAATVTEAKK